MPAVRFPFWVDYYVLCGIDGMAFASASALTLSIKQMAKHSCALSKALWSVVLACTQRLPPIADFFLMCCCFVQKEQAIVGTKSI